MRLIDADALSVKVEESKHNNPHGGLARLKNEHNHFWRMICDAPTVDAVEVVRCKDCVHSRELDKYEKQLYLPECVGCTKHSKSYSSVVMMGDDFCSYGERR